MRHVTDRALVLSELLDDIEHYASQARGALPSFGAAEENLLKLMHDCGQTLVAHLGRQQGEKLFGAEG